MCQRDHRRLPQPWHNAFWQRDWRWRVLLFLHLRRWTLIQRRIPLPSSPHHHNQRETVQRQLCLELISSQHQFSKFSQIRQWFTSAEALKAEILLRGMMVTRFRSLPFSSNCVATTSFSTTTLYNRPPAQISRAVADLKFCSGRVNNCATNPLTWLRSKFGVGSE